MKLPQLSELIAKVSGLDRTSKIAIGGATAVVLLSSGAILAFSGGAPAPATAPPAASGTAVGANGTVDTVPEPTSTSTPSADPFTTQEPLTPPTPDPSSTRIEPPVAPTSDPVITDGPAADFDASKTGEPLPDVDINTNHQIDRSQPLNLKDPELRQQHEAGRNAPTGTPTKLGND